MKKPFAAAILLIITALTAARAWPMAEFEYYEKSPEAAWSVIRHAVMKASTPIYGYAEPGRGAGAEEYPPRYKNANFAVTMPPGWYAMPRDIAGKDVVFAPRDKRIDILIEVKCIESDLELRGFTERLVKWSQSGGSGGYSLAGRTCTIYANLPCCLLVFDSAAGKPMQMIKLVRGGRSIYVVKSITDAGILAANFAMFRETLDSFRPGPGVAQGRAR